MLVRPIIVHSQMQRNIAGELGIELGAGIQKPLIPVSLVALAEKLARQCLQSSEQSVVARLCL